MYKESDKESDKESNKESDKESDKNLDAFDTEQNSIHCLLILLLCDTILFFI